MKSLLLLCLGMILCAASSAQDGSLYDSTAVPQLVSRQFAFTEGPSVDREGNVFFTDQPNNTIWKYDTNGKLALFMSNAGRANGTYFDKEGNLIACADENNQLWQITQAGKVKVLLQGYKGKLFNGPNDLWIDSKGNIYFTDPYYKRDYWKVTGSEMRMSSQKVFMLMKGQTQPIALDSMVRPNGIVGTPDGKQLFVADIGDSKIYQYTIGDHGILSNRRLFFAQGADGMTMDERGNLYLAGNGITIVNPKGKKIGHINIPEPWSANICFGGKDRDVLFITASKAIYTFKMNVKGVE